MSRRGSLEGSQNWAKASKPQNESLPSQWACTRKKVHCQVSRRCASRQEALLLWLYRQLKEMNGHYSIKFIVLECTHILHMVYTDVNQLLSQYSTNQSVNELDQELEMFPTKVPLHSWHRWSRDWQTSTNVCAEMVPHTSSIFLLSQYLSAAGFLQCSMCKLGLIKMCAHFFETPCIIYL